MYKYMRIYLWSILRIVVFGKGGIGGREEVGSGQRIACSEYEGWRVRLELAFEGFVE